VLPSSCHVFWIFGLSGAGKSTLAAALTQFLHSRGTSVLELDGDVLRTGLCRGLGFSDADRKENLRRAAEVARLGADSGLCVVASFITPLESQRRLVEEIIGRDRLSMIFADSPLDVCKQRDVKGLYAQAQTGLVTQMTGIGSAFDEPNNPDLKLSTSGCTPAESAKILNNFALTRLGQSR
jgi:adenylyl-sulfate kinase